MNILTKKLKLFGFKSNVIDIAQSMIINLIVILYVLGKVGNLTRLISKQDILYVINNIHLTCSQYRQ